jgi:DNA polymerase-3 subunit chi
VTQIEFYTNAVDKLNTACRLAAKAYAARARMLILCPDPETAQRIDRMLWIAPALGFLPHCAPDDPLASRTPVIVDANGGDPPHDDVLVNLRDDWPQYFSRFRRLIEIVSEHEEDRKRARDRFRFYRDRGYEIRTHDLSQTAR